MDKIKITLTKKVLRYLLNLYKKRKGCSKYGSNKTTLNQGSLLCNDRHMDEDDAH